MKSQGEEVSLATYQEPSVPPEGTAGGYRFLNGHPTGCNWAAA